MTGDETDHDNAAATQLRAILGAENVLVGEDIGENYRVDFMKKYAAKPGCLALPADTAQVSQVMQFASEARVPVTVIGGHSGMVGGAIAADGGILLSLERMNRIEEIDIASMTMTVEAGCILAVAQDEAEAQAAMLPLDLAARGSAMIGGVIGTNAGGMRVIRWGMMREMVLGLEVVTADGTILSSMTKMIKDNAGYAWKQLVIGSEGTLGIVTRAVLRLRPRPTTRQTALVATETFENAIRLLRNMEVALSGRLSSFELMWNNFYQPMTEAKSERPPIPAEHGFYAVIEALGGDAEYEDAHFEQILGKQLESGIVSDAVIAQSERERHQIWAVREASIPPHLTPFSSHDVSMAIADMPRFVEQIERTVAAAMPDAVMLVLGHAGDGNLHVIVHAGKDKSRLAKADELIYEAVQMVGGSIAAEHGIGLWRKNHIGMCRSEAELALMRRLKDAFDPCHILNPGKIIP